MRYVLQSTEGHAPCAGGRSNGLKLLMDRFRSGSSVGLAIFKSRRGERCAACGTRSNGVGRASEGKILLSDDEYGAKGLSLMSVGDMEFWVRGAWCLVTERVEQVVLCLESPGTGRPRGKNGGVCCLGFSAVRASLTSSFLYVA
jgi:hypothetical protein